MRKGTTVIVVDVECLSSAEDCLHCGAPDTEPLHLGHRCTGPHVAGHRFEPIGWGNKVALGLSIGCYWDSTDARCHFFDRHALEATMRAWVDQQPLLVSFNGLQFDFPLLRALLREEADQLVSADDHRDRQRGARLGPLCDAFKALCAQSYDLLAEIWRVDPDRRFERGLNSLDAIAQANGLGAKLSHGAQAPRDWQAGRYAQVINYCQDDVYKTKALFELVCTCLPILRSDGSSLMLRHPFPEEA